MVDNLLQYLIISSFYPAFDRRQRFNRKRYDSFERIVGSLGCGSYCGCETVTPNSAKSKLDKFSKIANWLYS